MEPTGGLFTTFPDGPGGTGTGNVYLIHDASSLYMCISSPVGTDAARFDSLYLDPQGDGTTYTYAQKDDFSLRLDFATQTNKQTFRGNGLIAGWTDSSAADNGKWSGAASTGTLDVVEYKVPLQNFGLSVCSSIFGLAAYHHWFAASGNDYGWPSNRFYDQPRTWQPVVLGSPACGTVGNIAYVFRGNTADASSFYSLLTGAGYTVTLVQAGALDQHTQPNVDIVRPATTLLSGLTIPFVAGNPDLAPHQLTFGNTLVGINPAWGVTITTGPGDPPPGMLPGGGQEMLIWYS